MSQCDNNEKSKRNNVILLQGNPNLTQWISGHDANDQKGDEQVNEISKQNRFGSLPEFPWLHLAYVAHHPSDLSIYDPFPHKQSCEDFEEPITNVSLETKRGGFVAEKEKTSDCGRSTDRQMVDKKFNSNRCYAKQMFTVSPCQRFDSNIWTEELKDG
ncbi:hypothetical protein DINM_005401 [Dirofilaria immitis]|nr:hypothetical protein [Dirofilaria immitis]